MPNGTYGGVRGKGAQAKCSRSPTYSILRAVPVGKLTAGTTIALKPYLEAKLTSHRRGRSSEDVEGDNGI